jgi:hypothetical protein
VTGDFGWNFVNPMIIIFMMNDAMEQWLPALHVLKPIIGWNLWCCRRMEQPWSKSHDIKGWFGPWDSLEYTLHQAFILCCSKRGKNH